MAETAQKGGLIGIAIAIAIGCVLGFIASFVLMAFTGETIYYIGIALSVVGFAGAIVWIFFITRKERPKDSMRERKITKKTVLWIIIAVISVPAAFGIYLLTKLYVEAWFLWFVIFFDALLAGLFIYSLIVLISGRSMVRKETPPSNHVLDTSSIEEID